MSPVALAVSEALPVPAATESVDLQRLQDELEEVAQQAAQARAEGLGLDRAVRDPRLPALVSFHRDLRDALFVEIDEPMVGWIGELRDGVGEGPGKLQRFADALANTARGEDASARSRALAELLVFEAVRCAWRSRCGAARTTSAAAATTTTSTRSRGPRSRPSSPTRSWGSTAYARCR
ncbi:MAG: hypothetical protein U0168_25085 [Nannocystaceae bacterium]